jgi:hypothetical protein
MDPLITNGIEPVMLRGLEKRGNERDPLPRRKRPPVSEKTVEGEESEGELGPEAPKHTLDDLA